MSIKKPHKGKALLPEEKKQIILLKKYFDQNRAEFNSDEPSFQKVSNALGIGVATVKRILASYNKDPSSINKINTSRGKPPKIIGESLQEHARSYIRSANLEGKYITLETIRNHLQNKSEENFHLSTLSRTLDRWGFEFGKGTRTQHLKEKDYVIAARRRYIRKMFSNRIDGSAIDTIRPEVYLDESYVNKNHSNDYVWYSSEDGAWIQKPTGQGERLIIINAITKEGWVPHAKTVFKSNRKTGDYHGQMNWEIFKKWFCEKLIPNIPEKSLIVMDNAPYHKVLSDASAPIASSKKSVIKSWLENNNIPCNPNCLKAELIEILAKVAPAPTYAIDEIAKEYGHEIVFTPPYHPELQPIELCWGILKNEVARHCDFTMNNLLEQLKLSFDKITPEICRKIIKKIRKIEDDFWSEDTELEQND